jgi:hypothetical protein
MSATLQRSLLLLSLLSCAAMWTYVQFILVPYQRADAVNNDRPRGNLSDLYPRWLGARELLLHHRDPYSPDITREIQVGYYGRPLDPNRPHDPKDQQAFAYPVYVVFLLAPTVGLSFESVQDLFFWFFLAITAASVLLWMDAIAWRVSHIAKLIWVLLTLGCFPAVQGLKLQQLSLLVAFFLAAFACLLARRQPIWAGIFLAFATIKPQLAFLPVLWLCIWALGDWRARQRAVWSFTVSMLVLVGAGEFMLPHWIGEFRAALGAYYGYTGGGKSVLDVAVSPPIGRVVSGIVILAFLVLAWRARHAPERSPEFQASLALSLAITLAVIPMFAPYNQLLLLPALMVIGRSVPSLWRNSPLSRFLVVVTAITIFEQWAAAVLLVAALLFLPLSAVQRGWELPLYLSLAIPLTVLGLLFVSRCAVGPQNGDPLLANDGSVLQPGATSE